jgi:DNA-directed RNA polymerase specialized sigma24 family protein
MPPDPDDIAEGEDAFWLDRLAAGDPNARDRIIELCSGRLRMLAHRMLARFPNVRRWDDTDDVFQNAALRLHRALEQTRPDSPRAMMALAATQLHRELIDLARRYSGPMSFAAHHATNAPGTGSDSSSSGAAGPGGLEAMAPASDDSLGVDQKTIADLLGCSERTVKTRWREAREAVRAALDGQPPR